MKTGAIQYTDNIFSLVIALLLLLSLALIVCAKVSNPITIPEIEVMQWSADTCWSGW